MCEIAAITVDDGAIFDIETVSFSLSSSAPITAAKNPRRPSMSSNGSANARGLEVATTSGSRPEILSRSSRIPGNTIVSLAASLR